MDKYIGYNSAEEKLIKMADEKKYPISGTLELLPLCNMNCDMCYVRLSHKQMQQKGKLYAADQWIDLAKQMKKAGVLFLLLTGGEPLLYPEFKKLFLALQQMGMIITINTNGTLLDEDWADFFGKNKPRRINITLYGGSEKTYEDLCHYQDGYKKTLHAIHLLNEYDVDVKANYTVTSKNNHELEQIVGMLNELKIPITVDTYMIPAKRERDRTFNMQSRLMPKDAALARINSWKLKMDSECFIQHCSKILSESKAIENKTLKYSNNIFCHAGNSSFTITWNGKMCPCLTLEQIAINVFDIGFETAWEYIVKETQKIRINSNCTECIYRPICRTCAACAIAESGEADGIPKYMCEYAEESLRLLKNEQ